MRIDVRNTQRERLFTVDVDPDNPPAVVRPGGAGVETDKSEPVRDGKEVYLNWEQAVDDQGHLRRCPVCSCRELFARKDFPQVTGFLIVVGAAIVAMGMFGAGWVVEAFVVLGAVAVIDAAIFIFTKRCVVCYRCRSEFRDLPIRRDHPTWELSIGEKYRQVEESADGGQGADAAESDDSDDDTTRPAPMDSSR